MDTPTELTTLSLEDLSHACPRLTPASGQYMADAAALCLNDAGHRSGVSLHVVGAQPDRYRLQWAEVTQQMRDSYDVEEATEYGACGVAILLLCAQTAWTVRRAFRGGGFDYWLGIHDENRPFQNLARLEISGIRQGDESRIRVRLREKREQTEVSNGTIPVYIVVVEFSRPQVVMERRG